jgi:hypothetical protein
LQCKFMGYRKIENENENGNWKMENRNWKIENGK